MSLIMWLIVGGILGWLASIVMKTNDRQGIILNIVVGVIGAFLGGLLLAPLFHTGTINQVAISPRNRKMNGHDPPKRATLSATRSPSVRWSCAVRMTGCAGSWRRDQGNHELL